MRHLPVSMVILAVTVVAISSCNSITGKKHINEGIIKYEITYDSITSKKIDTRLFPSALLVQFKNNNTLNTIDVFSGTVSLSIAKNEMLQQYITLVKVFNKKMYYDEPYVDGKYPALYARIPAVTLTSNNVPCKYLGYKCLKAKGYFADRRESEFEIIYTREIGIRSPNVNTPFEQIDGVMLTFNLRINSLMMILKAKSVRGNSIPDGIFEIPENYTRVDFQTITELIYLLQQ